MKYKERYYYENFYITFFEKANQIFFYNKAFFDNILFEPLNTPTKNLNESHRHNIVKNEILDDILK
jgi:hypothetical protein